MSASHRRPFLLLLSFAAVLAVGSCSSESAGPELPARIEFSVAQLDMGAARDVTIFIENPGEIAVGPVTLSPGTVRDAGGVGVPGSEMVVTPAEIPTLNPGAAADIRISIVLPPTVQPGEYDAALSARVPDGVQSQLDVRLQVAEAAPPSGDGEIRISVDGSAVRQGDVTAFVVEVRDADGQVVTGVPVTWTVTPPSSGFVTGNGQFVGFVPGATRVTAMAGSLSDAADMTVLARNLQGSMEVIGKGEETDHFSSDLWVHGDYVYQGTWGVRLGTAIGNTLFTWRVANPAAPLRTATLQVDARTVNDVKVRADGALALATHEASTDGQNGVTFLSLADPSRPAPISRFTQGLESGVHNAWLEGNYAYLVVDGSGAEAGLRVLDVSNPANPVVVASFYGGSSFLHDVYVRNGLAFLSHWNAGLIILDVGNGLAGGSPTNPVEVSRIATAGGQTHNAWYWPEKGYVFVGEEDFGSPGIMHVVDVRNLVEPREVATFRVPGTTPHNFWLDETRQVLYMGWYERGVRALDVSGELLGELDRQGREYAGLLYDGFGPCPGNTPATCTWAPQLHEGLIYAADMNGGLRVIQPSF